MKRVKQKWWQRYLSFPLEIQILYVFVKTRSLDLRGFVACTYLLYRIIRGPNAGIVLPSPTWDPPPHPLPVPDMLEPAMMPVQPLNITAKTELKLIICPVV